LLKEKLYDLRFKSVIYVSKYGNSFKIKLNIYTFQYSKSDRADQLAHYRSDYNADGFSVD